MNIAFIVFAVGRLLQVLGLALIPSAVLAYVELWPMPLMDMLRDGCFVGFMAAIAVAAIGGTAATMRPFPVVRGSLLREGFVVVSLGWVLLTAVGGIPFYSYFMSGAGPTGHVGHLRAATDAFFEAMSGLTTTGASVIPDVEVLPRAILFWRAMTHWLGGMGIVTLALAVFPAFGVAGYQMFKGEVPGPTKERLRPRLAQTAKILWGVYLLLTGAQIALLWFGGMSFFDAICHSFATVATGGFSTKNASIGFYQSPYLLWVTTVFMFLAGANFMLHFQFLASGRTSIYTRDPEFRFYSRVVVGAVLVITLALVFVGVADSAAVARSFRHVPMDAQSIEAKLAVEAANVENPAMALTHAAFTVVAVVTTTGFACADFDVWPDQVRLILVALMFFGACAGSTAGGIKMIRMLVVLKSAARDVRQEIEPRAIIPLKVTGRALDERQIADIVAFFVIFVILYVVLALAMSFIVPDLTTAATSVAATMCNVGPGLSGVGPSENFSWIPLGGKCILSMCMLLGRLEIFTFLIAISPITWRR